MAGFFIPLAIRDQSHRREPIEGPDNRWSVNSAAWSDDHSSRSDNNRTRSDHDCARCDYDGGNDRTRNTASPVHASGTINYGIRFGGRHRNKASN